MSLYFKGLIGKRFEGVYALAAHLSDYVPSTYDLSAIRRQICIDLDSYREAHPLINVGVPEFVFSEVSQDTLELKVAIRDYKSNELHHGASYQFKIDGYNLKPAALQ